MPKTKKEKGISDLQYLVLTALIPVPLYGYAIRKDIMERTDGQVEPSLATLYEVLSRQLADGFIERAGDEVIEGRLRRTYRITGLGEEAMTEKERITAAMLKPRTSVAGG